MSPVSSQIRTRVVQTVATITFALLCAPSARADFKAQLNSVTPHNSYATVNVKNTDSNNTFHYSSAIAGQLNWTVTSGTAPGGLTDSDNKFGTFCIEIPQHVGIGSKYNFHQQDLDTLPTSMLPAGGMGAIKAAQIEALWAAVYSTVSTGIQYAAFQLAIWEIDYERTTSTSPAAYSLSDGNFTATDVTSGVVAQATTYLASINGSTYDANTDTLTKGGSVLDRANLAGFKLTNSDGHAAQDQVGELPPPDNAPIPGPAPQVLVLAVTGLLPLGVRRIRKKLLGA